MDSLAKTANRAHEVTSWRLAGDISAGFRQPVVETAGREFAKLGFHLIFFG